tara:strand:- start:330 stop:434 length:105 start_codon:yes stop_codon:yes gene_type:complete
MFETIAFFFLVFYCSVATGIVIGLCKYSEDLEEE